MDWLTFIFLAAWSSAVLGRRHPDASDAPIVQILNGTVVGRASRGIESFNGIPYASPPTGNWRLKSPRTVSTSFGKLLFNETPRACPQQAGSLNTSMIPPKIFKLIKSNKVVRRVLGGSGTTVASQGEDCLTLDVHRSSGTNATSKLPVLFFIHGGAFQTGTTQQLNGSAVLNHAKLLGKEIILVATQYRLSGFGFLPGRALQMEGNTNLGLRDQRLALEWVQENIAQFGGDPDRVVIWGESAGAWSVFDHLLVNHGDHSYRGGKLFHGAIMDSGMAYPATSVSSKLAENIFQGVAKAGGCSSSKDQLDCLRSLSYESFLNASNSQASQYGYNSLDLPYLVRPDPRDDFFSNDPYVAIAKGRFARVPIISGSQEDEGTLWALMQSNITTTEQLVDYMQTWFKTASKQVVQGLVETYPDRPGPGTPFRTHKRNQLFAQFKRLGAILGDFCFSLSRRVSIVEMSPGLPATWSYLATYFHGTPAIGTAHATDGLLLLDNFGPNLPRRAILTYYISFINYLDPNRFSTESNLTHWPKYLENERSLLNLGAQNITVQKDNFRDASFEYLRKHRFSLKL